MLAVIATGVVLSTLEPGRADVAAGDFDMVADALDGPAVEAAPGTTPTATGERPIDTAAACSRSGRHWSSGSASSRPASPRHSCRSPGWRSAPGWSGIVVVVIPLVLQGRFRVTRVAMAIESS